MDDTELRVAGTFAEQHMRWSSAIHGKKGITWTARLKVGDLVFERSAKATSGMDDISAKGQLGR